MQVKNTEQRYGGISMLLHWSMAIIIIALLVVGLYMTRMPVSLEKLQLYGIHKEFGILVLMLAFLRVMWWVDNIQPKFPLAMPKWQQFAAYSVHLGLYGFMFAMPLTGWAMSSAAGLTVSFFGLFNLPNWVPANPNVEHLLLVTHHWLAFALIVCLIGHIGAALQHHFINRDDILRRMLP